MQLAAVADLEVDGHDAGAPDALDEHGLHAVEHGQVHAFPGLGGELLERGAGEAHDLVVRQQVAAQRTTR